MFRQNLQHTGVTSEIVKPPLAQIWSYDIGPPSQFGSTLASPAVADGVVYIGSADGNVYALNAVNGTKVWSFETGNPVTSSPAISGGIVYVAA